MTHSFVIDSTHAEGLIWPVFRSSALCHTLQHTATQCVAVCCSVLQRVAVCCSVLQCVAVCLADGLISPLSHLLYCGCGSGYECGDKSWGGWGGKWE